MKLTRTVISSMLLLAAGASLPAFAGLGGDATSVDRDRASLKGTVRVTTTATYAVHEISGASGMLVHEYLGADGKVFAVSWSGPGVPNLGAMLGGYYAEVQQAVSRPHYNHHHLSVVTPQVVLHSSGHLRTFAGRAWAPGLLPQNFAVTDIK